MISTFLITGHSVHQGDMIHVLIAGQCFYVGTGSSSNYEGPLCSLVNTIHQPTVGSITRNSVHQGDMIHVLIAGQCFLCRHWMQF